MYVIAQHIEGLLHYRRHSFCGFRVALEIRLESYGPKLALVVF